MNQPYVLQRFELRGKSLLIIEGTKFQMERCSAVAYIACKQEANIHEITEIMDDALKEAYGKQMDVVISEERKINIGECMPEAILYDIRAYHPLSFCIKYVPSLIDDKLYQYFDGRDIPLLSMMLFVPSNHQKYFESRSEYLLYKEVDSIAEWKAIEKEVADLHEQCIPSDEWLPKQEY